MTAGHTVHIGSRDAERGRLAAAQLGARSVQLDVTDDSSVAAAAKTLEADGGLDVLINNAGIDIEGNGTVDLADVTADMMRTVFDTNVFGVVRVIHAFLPLLRESSAPVIVNVSSSLASMSRGTTPGTNAHAYPGLTYPTSKTAVNRLTVQYAKAFPAIRINAVEPGYTRHRPQRPRRHPNRRGRGRDHRPHGPGNPGRPDRRLLRRRRLPALVVARRSATKIPIAVRNSRLQSRLDTRRRVRRGDWDTGPFDRRSRGQGA
ncbi:SDR family NAD(P)-dependent oxidoreductase [Nocardia niigatensis]